MKYLNMSGSPTLDKDLKFVYYSTHHAAMDPLLSYFAAKKLSPFYLEPSSMILFQFFKSSDGQIHIVGTLVEEQTSSVFYNDSSENFVSKIGKSLQEYTERVGGDSIEEICAKSLDASKPIELTSAQD